MVGREPCGPPAFGGGLGGPLGSINWSRGRKWAGHMTLRGGGPVTCETPPAVVFIIREARATLAHLQYLLVAAFFLCRQPPCSLLSPTHHRINFALSNCDHLLYLSPLHWPNPSSSNAESISRHVASPNWESCSTTVPARTCDQPTRPSSPSSFVWPCDRNLSACLPPTDRPRWPPVPPRSAYVFPPEPSPILRTVTDLTLSS